MPIDADVKSKFDEIDEDLKDHNNRLKTLEIELAKNNQTLEYLKESNDEIKDSVKRVETTALNTQNTILNSMNQLLLVKETNNSQEKISKFNNLTKIAIQVLINSGALLGGLVVGSKIVGN